MDRLVLKREKYQVGMIYIVDLRSSESIFRSLIDRGAGF